MVLSEKLNLGPQPIKTIIYLLLPLVFLLIIFPAVIQPEPVFISEYHDTMALMIPDLYLADNPFAMWNNNWLTGYSEISSLNTDRFYPFSFPLALASNSIFIINLILLVNLYIAFLAFYKLGGYLVKNPELLLIFSTAYMLSGVLLSRVFIGHIFFVYAMAWIPLIYYFFLKLTQKAEITVFNISALALCEIILLFTGGLYYVFFGNAILVIFFLYYLYSGRINRNTWIALGCSFCLFFSISAIKLIPNFMGMPYIQRIDLINPLGDGGLLENNFASFIFGTPIDTIFGSYETMALIGVIPVLFAILALIWGDRDITVPSFLAIVFSLIWADGGRILLSFVHLMPLVNSFRNAGRIFGAIMPIVLLLSLYGVYLLQQRIQSGEPLTITDDQKKAVLYGVAILAVIKVLELPWIAVPSIEALLALIIVFGFIFMVYFNKTTLLTLRCYLSLSLFICAVIIMKNFTILTAPVLVNTLLIGMLILGAMLLFNRNHVDKGWVKKHFFIGLLLVGLLFSIGGNISVLKNSDPHLSDSPALKIVEKIRETPSGNPQVWIFETGWPIQHMDFTYWFVKNGLHPMRAFYSYIPLNTPPLALQLNGMDYYLADYLVDTAYLENGNQNLPNESYKVDNISVFKPDHVLSNAFVVRGDLLLPSTIEKYSPDEIILSGSFVNGDIAVLKTAFSPGWKINGVEAVKISAMPGGKVQTDTRTITFRYDPLEAKIGVVMTAIGFFALISLFIKRKEFEHYLKGLETEQIAEKTKKGRRSSR
jgi:hypothetical protein